MSPAASARRRIVGEALIALLRESDTEPTARAVAERAGVSLRLVFHHFSDLDDLYHYVAALQFREQWSGMPELSPRLSLVKRIERIVCTAPHCSRRSRRSAGPWCAT